jgi:phosphoglycerate dehydrogenase-like enzyme
MSSTTQANTATHQTPLEIAVLDDYQGVALELADWSVLGVGARVTAFRDHIDDEDQLVERLLPHDIVCVMRERTPLSAAILQRLPRLKLIASTGSRNRSIDAEAASRQGIEIVNTGYTSTPTIEFTWALILGIARNIASENASVRAGGWQKSVGSDLAGKTLGVLGLGNIGSQVAAIGRAFGMKVVAWSQNLTAERAAAAGAEFVTKSELLQRSDFLSVHLILSGRTKGLLGTAELSEMKPTAFLINTSRGPIIDEQALVNALRSHQIAGAAVDVYDIEPLPQDHPFRTLPNVLATPHIGYVSRALYETFYGDTVKQIQTWIASRPATNE